MTPAIPALLARARTELDAACVLLREGFEAQSTSRAYYAAFFAAEAALLALGVSRSKHSGVIAAFGRLIVKDGGLDHAVGSSLRRLFELRNAADYTWLDDSGAGSAEAIEIAEQFVQCVTAWIEQQAQ